MLALRTQIFEKVGMKIDINLNSKLALMRLLPIILAGMVLISFTPPGFKEEQMRYPRVRQAFREKEAAIERLLQENGLVKEDLRIYLRYFKREKELELWAGNRKDSSFMLIRTYPICSSSGTLGPKRKRGDLQVPEGFYHINIFNPASSFHLSMGINYPNRSDRVLGVRGNLGGDIFIHGDCVTIGCIPITDELIKELYVICVEAKNSGQARIPVTGFPARLSERNYRSLIGNYSDDPDRLNLWSDLKSVYRLFNETKQLPSVEFLSGGRHRISQ